MNAERIPQRYAPRLSAIGSLHFTSLWVRAAPPATLAIATPPEAGSFLATEAGGNFVLPRALFCEVRGDFIAGRRRAADLEELHRFSNCNGLSAVIAIGSKNRNCLPQETILMEIGNYLAGISLGLALIVPIGPQNLYIINAGLALGVPRVFLATLATTACDAILISLGTLGAGIALTKFPSVHALLLAAGVLFLGYLGIQSFRATTESISIDAANVGNSRVMARRALGVSLLNPHAILDTTVAIGTAAAASEDIVGRVTFGLGAVTASLMWFVFLGVGAATLRKLLTPKIRQTIERLSGTALLVIALMLAIQLVHCCFDV
ncbi:MAG: LysE family transporter [Mycobacterium sp.]|nr:LysE family transporter [Mycobacterium sp.]